MNISKINEQLDSLKERVLGLDKSGIIYYEIWAYIPETSADYQLYYKGNNKTSSIADKFTTEIDTILGINAAKIKITLKSNKKNNFGDTEIVLREQYQSDKPSIRPLQEGIIKLDDNEQKVPFTQPQTQAQPQTQSPSLGGVNQVDFFGALFAPLGGISSESLGGLGQLLNLRENKLAEDFERQRKDEKYENLLAENAVLKEKITTLTAENASLERQIDKLEDKVDDLEREVEEYEKLNPQRNAIGNTLGLGISKAVEMVMTKKSVKSVAAEILSGFMGIGNDDDEQTTTTDDNVNVVEIVEQPQSEREIIAEQLAEQTKQQIASMSEGEFEAMKAKLM
jgi:hypothetical protein